MVQLRGLNYLSARLQLFSADFIGVRICLVEDWKWLLSGQCVGNVSVGQWVVLLLWTVVQ